MKWDIDSIIDLKPVINIASNGGKNAQQNSYRNCKNTSYPRKFIIKYCEENDETTLRQVPVTISRIDFEKSICRPFQLRKLKLNSEYKLTLGHIGLDGSFNFVDQCSTRNLASTCGTTTNANTTDIEPKIDTSTNLLFNENTTNIAQTSSSSTAKNSAGSKKLEEKLSEISNMSPSEMKVSSTSEQDSVVNIKNSKGKTAKNSNSTQKSEKNNASKNSKQGNSDKNVSKKINNATSTSRHNHPGGHGPNDSSSQGEGQNQNQLSAITASSSIDSGKPSSSKFTNSSATIDDMTVSPHSIGLLQTVDQDQLQNQHQQAVDLQKLKNIGDTITNLKLSGLHFSGVKFQWQFLNETIANYHYCGTLKFRCSISEKGQQLEKSVRLMIDLTNNCVNFTNLKFNTDYTFEIKIVNCVNPEVVQIVSDSLEYQFMTTSPPKFSKNSFQVKSDEICQQSTNYKRRKVVLNWFHLPISLNYFIYKVSCENSERYVKFLRKEKNLEQEITEAKRNISSDSTVSSTSNNSVLLNPNSEEAQTTKESNTLFSDSICVADSCVTVLLDQNASYKFELSYLPKDPNNEPDGENNNILSLPTISLNYQTKSSTSCLSLSSSSHTSHRDSNSTINASSPIKIDQKSSGPQQALEKPKLKKETPLEIPNLIITLQTPILAKFIFDKTSFNLKQAVNMNLTYKVELGKKDSDNDSNYTDLYTNIKTKDLFKYKKIDHFENQPLEENMEYCLKISVKNHATGDSFSSVQNFKTGWRLPEMVDLKKIVNVNNQTIKWPKANFATEYLVNQVEITENQLELSQLVNKDTQELVLVSLRKLPDGQLLKSEAIKYNIAKNTEGQTKLNETLSQNIGKKDHASSPTDQKETPVTSIRKRTTQRKKAHKEIKTKLKYSKMSHFQTIRKAVEDELSVKFAWTKMSGRNISNLLVFMIILFAGFLIWYYRTKNNQTTVEDHSVVDDEN